MTQFILRRLLYAIPTLFIIVAASFFGMRAVPGGPFASEPPPPPRVRANMEKYYGLDKPLPEQFARYVLNVVQGDLGTSFTQPDRTVNELILSKVHVSAQLGALALLLALTIGIPAGLVGALNHNRLPDYTALVLALIGASLPNFVLGPLFMLLFSIRLDWLPVAGWGSPQQMILPALTLCFAPAAFVARLTRAGALEVIRQDYIRTARAKGLREGVVVFRHALKLSLLPLVSYLGPASAALLTGSLVVERIFSVPGIGSYFIQSALNRDYTMVMGTVLVYSVLLITLNLAVDILYGILDPRIRYS
jgi:oligopeptide transport system permease protein